MVNSRNDLHQQIRDNGNEVTTEFGNGNSETVGRNVSVSVLWQLRHVVQKVMWN